ncbi:MAG: hypothetical protein ACE14V_08975 [bacterium]
MKYIKAGMISSIIIGGLVGCAVGAVILRAVVKLVLKYNLTFIHAFSVYLIVGLINLGIGIILNIFVPEIPPVIAYLIGLPILFYVIKWRLALDAKKTLIVTGISYLISLVIVFVLTSIIQGM